MANLIGLWFSAEVLSNFRFSRNPGLEADPVSPLIDAVAIQPVIARAAQGHLDA